MDKTFLHNITRKQFVNATKQVNSALSHRVMETLAGRKVEIARSIGVPVKESVEEVVEEEFVMGHESIHPAGTKVTVNHPNSVLHGKKGTVVGHEVEATVRDPSKHILFHKVKVGGETHSLSGHRLEAGK